MRPAILAVLEQLLSECPEGGALTLDRVGEALGTMSVSADEIDALIAELEARGRQVCSPSGGAGESVLSVVLAAARVLAKELGRAPSVAELAARTSVDQEAIRHALALARVIARG